MAYGRKATRRKGYGRRGTGARKPYRAKRAVPVPRKKKPSYVRRNSLAINRLSRITRQIRNMTYGSVQKSYQKLEHDSLLLDSTHPILFDGTDFTRHTHITAADGTATHEHGCRIYSLNVNTGTLDANVAIVSSYFVNAQETNPFYTGQKSDIVDGGQYKPLSAYYNFKFKAMDVKAPIFITITCFTVRANKYVHGAHVGAHRDMPQGLLYMKKVADPTENRLNPEFFNIYSCKKMVIMPPRNTTLHTCERHATLSVHPKKVRTQLVTNPTNDDDYDTEAVNGNFGSVQTPFAEPFWILISSSQDKHITGHAGASLHMDMSRNVTWRDRVGAV